MDDMELAVALESFDDPSDSLVFLDRDYQVTCESTVAQQALNLVKDPLDDEVYNAEQKDDVYDIVDVEVTEEYDSEAEDLFDDDFDDIIDAMGE